VMQCWYSSGTEGMTSGLRPNLSPASFAVRSRDGTANRPLVVVLASDVVDETEDDREVRDTSEIIDSGDEAVEYVVSDGRLAGTRVCGGVTIGGQQSIAWAALALMAWLMAIVMDEPLAGS